MGGDDDRGTEVTIHLLNHASHDNLTGGIEVVEGLVEQQHFGMDEHSANDTYLLAVALAEVMEELASAQDFVVHQGSKGLQTLVDRRLRNAIEATDEGEILLGRIEVDEEATVHKGTGIRFPGFALTPTGSRSRYINAIREHTPFSGFDKVEHQAQKGGLTRTIITHQAHEFTALDGQRGDVQCHLLAILFLEVFYSEFHI